MTRDDSPQEEQELTFADDLVAILSAFRDGVYNPRSVLYPSCGYDASPAQVFDRVTFVDIEQGTEGCVGKLQEAGLHAIKGDIRDYHPQEEHDLLILLNPAIPSSWTTQHLVQGGFILANNYHGNASEMFRQPESYELWGTIDFVEKDRRKEDMRMVVSRDLTDLFVPCENEEELRTCRPSMHTFIETSYHGMLQSMGMTPEKDFVAMYQQFQRMMGDPIELPSKRSAERYIFVKK